MKIKRLLHDVDLSQKNQVLSSDGHIPSLSCRIHHCLTQDGKQEFSFFG
jgi:hypothetical protein